MELTASKKYELEAFISDWHWDKESHKFAMDLGAFLLGFMDYLVLSGASDRVCRAHKANLWNIGIFACQYGDYEKFSPNIFKSPPFYEHEFKRKISDTIYALNSYSATCNRLSKYANKHLYKTIKPAELELSGQIADFIVGLQLLEPGNRGLKKGDNSGFQQEIKMILNSCRYKLNAMNDSEDLGNCALRCAEIFDKIALKLASFPLNDHYRKLTIRENLLADVHKLKSRFLENRGHF